MFICEKNKNKFNVNLQIPSIEEHLSYVNNIIILITYSYNELGGV